MQGRCIRRGNTMDEKNTKLSVLFITYNHEPYLRRSLDGILMQECDFEYEIVVGEDCSTDNTRAILIEYKEKYPDKFVLLFREKNFGRPTMNVYDTGMHCRGEYLAFLEGDDYWTDTHKLQKQVDFLDSHADYMGCTHTCITVGKNDELLTDVKPLSLYDWDGDFTMEDYKSQPCWPGQTATVVSRNFFKEGKYDYTILYKAHDFLDDGVILLFLLMQGKIFRMKEVMSAWRFIEKSGEGNWNSLKLMRNQMAEDCLTKRRLLQWCEENFGLTDYGRNLAYKDYVTAVSIFIKRPCSETYSLMKELFGYNIKHVMRGDKLTLLWPYTIGVIVKTVLTGRKK